MNPEAGAACAQFVRRHPRTGVYIGRERELEELTALAAQAGSRSGLVTVVGAAGTGKTALALQWSRRAEADFPDGQLFVDLRGHSEGDPLTPKEALTTLLSSLGTAYQDIPHREAELAELYQRALVGRRVLVVLDNAESADQVSGLVPYGLGCLALVTSRSRLGGLIVRHGASTLRLGPLATAEAEELLRSIIGAVRAGSEPQALADLVKVCGGNALALRIVAANLAVNPDCRLADYAGALRSGNPLEHLSVAGDPGSAVRRAFELTRQRLDPETAEAFRMLGLLPGPATTVAAVAALLGLSVRAAQALLDRLYSIHLVESIMRERVRLPDLIWWYARFLADEEQPAQVRREGRRRLLRWYLGAADAAARCLHPQFPRLELPGPGRRPRRRGSTTGRTRPPGSTPNARNWSSSYSPSTPMPAPTANRIRWTGSLRVLCADTSGFVGTPRAGWPWTPSHGAPPNVRETPRDRLWKRVRPPPCRTSRV